MNQNHSNDPRPTGQEEQAFASALQYFAEHLAQFATSLDTVRHLEQNLARTAVAVNTATAQTRPGRVSIQTDDGSQWKYAVDLMDNISVCYRPTSGGPEFAVVEKLPSNETNEVLTRSCNALDVLRTFARDQNQALQLWTADATARVHEYLAEKYPGQDTSRVAGSFMRRFTQGVSTQETLAHEQKHSRGIRV